MSQFSLQDLLSPMPPEDFFGEYWEEKPLLIPRSLPKYYQSLFSVADLDSLFLFAKPHPPDIKVVANQQEMLPSKYLQPTGELNLNQLYKAYQQGHTIIVNGIERFWSPLATFCNSLQNYLNHRVVANLYFSPKQSKGLQPHYDTHDVFVLQVEGSKHWEVHQPSQPTPLLNSFQPVIPEKNLGEPLQAIDLEPGDLLYIPRGFVHHAATSDSFSLHVTIGVYPDQWLDLITQTLTAVAMRDVRFRKALPVGYLDRPEVAEMLQERLDELVGVLGDKAKLAEALSLLADRQIRQTIPIADGQFGQLNLSDTIDASTEVMRRGGIRCRIIDNLFAVSLQFSGNTISFPYSYRSALEMIAESTQAFGVRELPNLSEAEQIQLSCRLVQSGVLQII